MFREAEMGIIGGAMLWNKQWPPEVFALEPEYFEDRTCSRSWGIIRGLIDDGKGVDLVTIGKASPDEYLGEFLTECLDATVTAENLKTWCSELTEEGRVRWAAREMRNAAERFHDNPEALAAEIRRIEKRMCKDATLGLSPVKGGISEVLREIEDEIKNPDAGLRATSGLDRLDDITRLGPGQLTIVAGRPGMGKSSFAVGVAMATAKKFGNVAIFSLEMTRSAVVRKMLTAHGNVVIDGTKTNWAKLSNAASAVNGLGIFIDDRPGLSVRDIRQALLRVPDVSLVVVDYLQLCKMDSKIERQDLRVGAVTKGLRAIAKDRGCHMMALSQLNRAVEQRNPPRPGLSDLRDSGNIEEDADNIWFLYREGYYKQVDGSHNAEIIVGKNRHGRTGFVNVDWRPETQVFLNPPKYTHWEGP